LIYLTCTTDSQRSIESRGQILNGEFDDSIKAVPQPLQVFDFGEKETLDF